MHKGKSICLGCLIFCSGWFFGLWVENWAFITLSFEIPAINLLTTIATLLVTIYVAKLIQKSVQNRNSQNQLLIKRIEEIDKLVEDIEHSTSSNGFSYIGVLAKFKNLQVSCKRVLDEIKRLYPKMNEPQYLGVLPLIHQSQGVAMYIPHQGSNGISVDHDKVTYTSSKRAEVYSTLSIIRDKLFDLQVGVNGQ